MAQLADEEDAALTGGSGGSVAAASGAPPDDETPENGRTIWEDDKIQKFVCTEDSVKKWKCLWCNKVSFKWNATKATAHMARRVGKDISVCTAKHDELHRDFYRSLQTAIDKKRKRSSTARTQCSLLIETNQTHTAEAIEQSRNAKRRATTSSCVSQVEAGTTFSTMSSVASTPNGMIQLTVDAKVPNASNELALTVAIADLIHSCGLPFSLANEPKLARIIKLARGVSSTFTPPYAPRRCEQAVEVQLQRVS